MSVEEHKRDNSEKFLQCCISELIDADSLGIFQCRCSSPIVVNIPTSEHFTTTFLVG